jgi:hypothetical protein
VKRPRRLTEVSPLSSLLIEKRDLIDRVERVAKLTRAVLHLGCGSRNAGTFVVWILPISVRQCGPGTETAVSERFLS